MLVCKLGIAKQVHLTMVLRKGGLFLLLSEGCVPVREIAFTKLPEYLPKDKPILKISFQ